MNKTMVLGGIHGGVVFLPSFLAITWGRGWLSCLIIKGGGGKRGKSVEEERWREGKGRRRRRRRRRRG